MATDTLDIRFCMFQAHVNSVDFRVELGRQLPLRRLSPRLIGPQDPVPFSTNNL